MMITLSKDPNVVSAFAFARMAAEHAEYERTHVNGRPIVGEYKGFVVTTMRPTHHYDGCDPRCEALHDGIDYVATKPDTLLGGTFTVYAKSMRGIKSKITRLGV